MKGKKKPKYYGTVAPYPNFSASSDVAVLQNAIESKGVLAHLSYDLFIYLFCHFKLDAIQVFLMYLYVSTLTLYCEL